MVCGSVDPAMNAEQAARDQHHQDIAALRQQPAPQSDEAATLRAQLAEAQGELARFRAERSYVVGANDGYEAATEHTEEENVQIRAERDEACAALRKEGEA